MEFCNRLNKTFVLFFTFLLLISFAFAELQKTENILSVEEEGITTLTFQQSDQMEMISIQGSHYTNAKPDSFIKVVNGSISEANMTASKETTWRFGNDTIKVQEGMRVVYKNGTLEIFGKEDSINITQDFQGTRKLEFSNNEQGDLEIKGDNFNVEGIQVKQGSLSVVNGGYVLGENSLADWKGLTLGNGKDLFLATSETAYNSWEGSALFPDNLRLRGKGEGFDILFNEENEWAEVESVDLFAVSMGEESSFDLLNRKSKGLIPEMTSSGAIKILQNGKGIFIKNDKIHMESSIGSIFDFNYLKNNLDNKIETITGRDYASENTLTTPVELKFLDSSGEIMQEKVIVTNFRGFGIGNLDAKDIVLEERYENSLIYKRARNSITYNYPTIADFEAISDGKTINFNVNNSWGQSQYSGGSPLYQPLAVRELIDYWETLPDSVKNSVKSINVYSADMFNEVLWSNADAIYEPRDNSINLQFDMGGGLSGGYSIFRHEMTHATHDFFGEGENTRLKVGGEEYIEYYNLKREHEEIFRGFSSLTEEEKIFRIGRIQEIIPRLKELDTKYGVMVPLSFYSEFSSEWLKITPEEVYKQELAPVGMLGGITGITWKDGGGAEPKYGFVRPYGSTNINEDVATFTQMVVSDPLFFQRHNLLGGDSIYTKKIKLLKENGFITEAEYDPVFNPEKYFSQEEIEKLMRQR
jgi:hypothetical protein